MGASPKAIVAYHESGHWDADISTVIRRAKRHLRAHLSEPHPAIVLDVDGDGSLDLIATVPGSGYVVTLKGAGGLFVKQDAETLKLPAGVDAITLGASAP